MPTGTTPLPPVLRLAPVERRHLQDIAGLARLWQADPAEAGRDGDQGFVMSTWDAAEYGAFLGVAEKFLVLLREEEMAGFMLAYTHRHAHLDPMIHAEIARYLPAYLLVEMICIAPGWNGQGLGSHFMSLALDAAGELPVVSEVSSRPRNVASERMHLRLGFIRLAELDKPDGFRTTIWVRYPPAVTRTSSPARS